MDGTSDLIERLLDHARLHDEQADFDDEQKAFAADLREAASVISAHRKVEETDLDRLLKICKEAHEAFRPERKRGMSKQSDAKKEQNYREVPDTCANCGHYESQMIEKTYDAWHGKHAWHGKQTWTEEKEKRCTIGGFAVKKMATCDRHVLVTPNEELRGRPLADGPAGATGSAAQTTEGK